MKCPTNWLTLFIQLLEILTQLFVLSSKVVGTFYYSQLAVLGVTGMSGWTELGSN